MLYPQKVKLRDEDHRYFHENGDEYLSFSRLYNYVVDPFNADSAAYFVAKAQGKTKEEVLQEWTDKRDNGSRIDKALETYAKDKIIWDADVDIETLIRSVNSEYLKYHSTHEQLDVYSEEYRTAGRSDKLFLFSNRKDSAFGISDFKAFEDVLNTDGTLKHTAEESLFVHRGWCKNEFSHLPNTKFTKISMQLSVYAFYFEGLTGRKCKELFIHLINATKKTHGKIMVPYLKNDVKMLLEVNRENILNQLKPESVF